LVRRTDDGHRVAESFFAGIVQALHQIDGLCFLIFAERGLWNRFVPSLDGYIQDRLNNPVHVPGHGTIKTLRLEAPPPELVRRIVEARLRPALEELPDFAVLPSIFPFTDEQITRIAKTEPTLRDMLQQFRHLFDHVVYGADSPVVKREAGDGQNSIPSYTYPETPVNESGRSDAGVPVIKSVVTVESPVDAGQKSTEYSVPSIRKKSAAGPRPVTAAPSSGLDPKAWDQVMQTARQQLEPEGAVTGATRELQAGLGAFLQACHEHGVKVGPWRLQHVVSEFLFSEHPTYGVITIAPWVCKDGQPWKVGIGLFPGPGPGKPKDLDTKLLSLEAEPAIIDHLVLLRPEDDITLTGKSKSLWQDAERRGPHARLEPLSLDGFAVLYGFPRWLATLTEALPEGQPLPN